MRMFCVCWLVAGLTVLSGCGEGGTPGGPGVGNGNGNGEDGKASGNGSALGTGEETFKIDVPFLSTKVTQGTSESVKLALERGKNFDEDVTLTFSNLPRGVTIQPEEAKIAASEPDVEISVTAAVDAALGDFTITVIGKPTKGADATHKLKVTVKAQAKPDKKEEPVKVEKKAEKKTDNKKDE